VKNFCGIEIKKVRGNNDKNSRTKELFTRNSEASVTVECLQSWFFFSQRFEDLTVKVIRVFKGIQNFKTVLF